MKEHQKEKIHPWTILVWLALWQIAAMIIDQRIILVSPADAFTRLAQLMTGIEFWHSVINSLLHVLEGFFLALAAGILSAAAAHHFKWFKDLLALPVQAAKSVPVASFIILVLFYASRQAVSVIISFLMVFPVIYENLLTGIENCDVKLLEMAEVFELPKHTVFKAIWIPQVLPYLESACSLSLGLAWKSGIAAEVIAMPDHTVGNALYEAKIYLDTVDVFAWTIAVVLLSVLFQKGFMKLLKYLFQKMQNGEDRL